MTQSGGGSGTGGSAGNAGSAGTHSVPVVGTCVRDAECRMYNDCCGCLALGPGEATPACAIDCEVSACTAAGIDPTEVRCVAGRCVLDRACPGERGAACLPPPPLPACPDGELRFFDRNCNTGCLPLTQCSEVDSCERCEQAGLTCVFQLFSGRGSQSFHCVSTPAACDGSCECMRVCNESGASCTPRQFPTALECSIDCPTC